MTVLRRVSYSMRSPLVTAHGPIDRRDALLVGAERDGHVGWGEVSPLPGFGMELDLDLVERRIAEGQGHPAVEWARADAEARLAGVWLAELFGANQVERIVPVNATIGDSSPAETADRCRRLASEGYRCIKLKVAAGTLGRDLERVEAARGALGPTVELRLDANQGWSLAEAHQALPRLGELGIAFVEEPTNNPDDLVELNDHGVALALDESLTGDSLLERVAGSPASVIVVKPAAIGGPAAALELIGFAEAAGKRVIVTSFFDGPIGLATACHLAATLAAHGPHGVGTASQVIADYPDELIVEAGSVRLPDSPGIGVDPQ